ncbi:MAG TPA: hypothetical protein VKB86_12905 [Pyrinomonadaceae bacterium]|nr:hypothetical protein [Pyrinomonadaceae bacterium]
MLRLIKTLLLAVLLLCGASAVLWRAQGSNKGQRIEARTSATKSFMSVMVRADGGSYVLVDLTLKRMMSSSILKGNLINRTTKTLDNATFEVKAYDREGNLLRGVEEKTIFTASQIEAGGNEPLNAGYGVWLQGIPPDAISRLEVSEIGDETGGALQLRSIPLVSYTVFSEEYSEIEE